ncbi:MAG: calcium/sodium antiporter, partial [Gammaproteobacteria bacterium]|nr:calcium/sodium antiporter [Gammaproteobacteria bacterium]
SIPGLVRVEVLEPSVLSRDYAALLGITLLLALVLYASLLRPSSRMGNGEIRLGRSIGTLLLSSYALYYYWLYLTV